MADLRAKTADPQFFLRPALTSAPINLYLQSDLRATLWHSILFDYIIYLKCPLQRQEQ